jgi:hypothetical protein
VFVRKSVVVREAGALRIILLRGFRRIAFLVERDSNSLCDVLSVRPQSTTRTVFNRRHIVAVHVCAVRGGPLSRVYSM